MSYAKDMDRMLELVFRDHGGCDEPDCSLRIAMEDEYNPEEAIWLWACSGAACEEFNALMDKHEKRFKVLEGPKGPQAMNVSVVMV